MKITPYIVLFAVVSLTGCTDKKATETKAREEADAKVRADAAKKEMQTLPEAFQPRYNKRLDQAPPKPEPDKQPEQKKAP
ncbi:MAG TPA: hypothetical protein VHO24_13895 [Opitutaceae bacterium]|nr:hypothetical protein [Opitutaceae bacterium]